MCICMYVVCVCVYVYMCVMCVYTREIKYQGRIQEELKILQCGWDKEAQRR